MAELSKAGNGKRATTSRALKQFSASERTTDRSGLGLTASRIRLRASCSLIITNQFNPERFRGQSAMNNWQSAILRDILALLFGEVAEWLKAALC
jgi:hypothetical protein